MDMKDRIDEIYDLVREIRRDLHQNPELSECEARTRGKVVEYLKLWGVEYQLMRGNYGVVGIIRGKRDLKTGQPEKTVAIRADMDALPISEVVNLDFRSQNDGVMHACGHDLHTAILLGTAKILKDMEEELSGNVKLFFQPAEETIGGALPMIEEGCMDNPAVSAVIALHAAPAVPVGAVQMKRGKQGAASNEFEIVLKGRACHGAHPEDGKDALVAGCHLVGALQTIASRELSASSPGVLTVGQFHSGTKNNIIPGEAKISGIFRTLSPEVRRHVKRRVEEIARSTADMFQMEADVSFVDSYPALINDDDVTSVMERVARENLPEGNLYFMEAPSMGTDDFAYFCEKSKGCYFNLGTKPNGEIEPQALHSNHFCPDESCMRTGMLMELMGVLALLSE